MHASVYACIPVHLYLLCAGKVGRVGKTWPLRCWFASSLKLCCKHATRTAHPAQARCTMQVPRKLAPTSCETNLDDGVEVPSGAHSDQSQGPFCGVRRSERRMEACHLRRANCHWRTLPCNPMLLAAQQASWAHLPWALMPLDSCHKPRISACVFLYPATQLSHAEHLWRTIARGLCTSTLAQKKRPR